MESFLVISRVISVILDVDVNNFLDSDKEFAKAKLKNRFTELARLTKNVQRIGFGSNQIQKQLNKTKQNGPKLGGGRQMSNLEREEDSHATTPPLTDGSPGGSGADRHLDRKMQFLYGFGLFFRFLNNISEFC